MILVKKIVLRNLLKIKMLVFLLAVAAVILFVFTAYANADLTTPPTKINATRLEPAPKVTITSTTVTTTQPVVVVTTQPEPKPIVITPSDIWFALADCESGGRWDYNGGSGYDGGLQFLPSTWTRMHTHWGATTGYEYAWQAPKEIQIEVAIRLMNVSSGAHSQWPACSKKIGMPNRF